MDVVEVVTPSGQILYLEKAQTNGEKSTGLMHRKTLPHNRGMWFVYQKPQVLCFWMKNTPIDLALLVLDQENRIQEIHHLKPLDETRVCSKVKGSTAMEISPGAVQDFRLKIGDKLFVKGKTHVPSP